MTESWQSRHPFAVGATVYARAQHELGSFGLFLKPGEGYVVRLRGEDAYGLWVAVEGVVECLPVRLFTSACPPVMPAVSEDVEAA
jgi:hypothetical protein